MSGRLLRKYRSTFLDGQSLARYNPALAKYEKDFIAGKLDGTRRDPHIKVFIEYADGSKTVGPVKPSSCTCY